MSNKLSGVQKVKVKVVPINCACVCVCVCACVCVGACVYVCKCGVWSNQTDRIDKTKAGVRTRKKTTTGFMSRPFLKGKVP